MFVLAVVLFVNPCQIFDVWSYPVDYVIRIILAYVIISLFTYFYELDRMNFKKAIREEHDLLFREKERLSAANAEVEAVNRLLNTEMEFRKRTEEELRIHRDNLEDLVNDRTRELQRYNRELAESEKRYRLLADNVTDIIWSVDLNFNTLYVSPSIVYMYGYTADEMMAQPPFVVQTPESKEKILAAFKEQIELEKTEGADLERNVVLQLEQKKKDGTIFNVEIRASFIRDDAGTPIGIVGITRDITERVRIQREKEKIQEQLGHAQKMEAIGTLVGGLAHDFNNVLSGILGSFDLLNTLLKDEALANRNIIEKYLNVGMESAKRSVGLIKDLLALSHGHEIRLEPIDLNDVVRHIYDLCFNSFPKSIDLNFMYSSQPAVILGDDVQMGQVILNLCINASHAMTIMRNPVERQGGTLSVGVERIHPDQLPATSMMNTPSSEQSWVRIMIEDTGVGMDQETMTHIYEPFFSKKRQGQGSGLGLSISYNIIQKHNGIIQVYSQPGAGTRFLIYFPAIGTEARMSIQKSDETEPVKGEGTILVIDDEQMILKVAKGFLEKCGYTVLTASTPDAGIDVFRERYSMIDGVIIDLSMPGKSGLEVFRALKQIYPGVKALLSSGMLDSESRDMAREMGFLGFVNKPYLMREISVKVKNMLERI